MIRGNMLFKMKCYVLIFVAEEYNRVNPSKSFNHKIYQDNELQEKWNSNEFKDKK